MHVHFEQNATTRSDCTVHALSWMGKVPDQLPEDEGWKLNRLQYYQEGWLSLGNSRGIVGVTFTACHCKKQFDSPPRANFNLRGHRNEVVLVKWNEPYQKLATCDSTGVIFVWIKHEGRWSIELINDRNSQVTDFAWSHDGRMALICYRDGFVLVGSVAGQRYWSSMLNLDTCMITCGIWSPDDTKVLFGTTDGQLIVMSSTGAMLIQVTISDGHEITTMGYSCEKFQLDEQGNDNTSDEGSPSEKNHVLAVCFRSGIIHLMSNYDDPCPRIVNTGLTGIKMEWCNEGEILTVGGFVRLPNLECSNEILFYTPDAHLRYRVHVPNQGKPITALTWGHNNKRLFVAAGCYIFTAWVTKQVAKLQYLCRRAIHSMLKDDSQLDQLPLPSKLSTAVASLFVPTIKGYIPDPLKLREFVCIPPPHNERLHCTMIRHGDENSAGQYTLYLEYLGGLIPLLKGKRHSKIRPEFVIYDPKIKLNGNGRQSIDGQSSQFVSSESDVSDTDSDTGEGCGSPRMQRKRRLRKQKARLERRDSSTPCRPLDELLYDDNLPEVNTLIEVTSNIWGTKFKINGVASYLPQDLGQVLYKTSLLHLQPRQMTITILELGTDLSPQDHDPSYNPNNFGESDDEYLSGQPGFQETVIDGAACPVGDIPISPEICINPQRLSTIHGSTDALNSQVQESAMEVPVIVEKHAAFQNVRVDKSSPLEIRSLEGSPPQRRSPSLKSRSLSPAEPFTYMSNSLVDSIGDNSEMFPREMYMDKGAVPKIRMNANTLSVNGAAEIDSDSDVPSSPHAVVQLAARKLEDVIQRHRCYDNSQMMMAMDERGQDLPRWADRAVHEIKYIDDEADMDLGEHSRQEPRDTVYCTQDKLSAREIMRSTQMLVDINNASPIEAAVIEPSSSSSRKRVVLAHFKKGKSKNKTKEKVKAKKVENVKHKVKGHQRAGSVDVLLETRQFRPAEDSSDTPGTSATNSPVLSERHMFDLRRGSLEMKRIGPRQDIYSQGMDSSQSTSLPTSPVRRIVQPQAKRAKSKQDVSSFRSRLQSPLFGRKLKNYKAVDSSDDEVVMSGDEIMLCHNYKNLETFQKAQLSRKLRKARNKCDASECRDMHPSPKIHRKRHFVMHNKAPLWNESSQVYQLDFGGRVTQESAKNFQIEFRGKQVMQFGRIDTNAYTLDFQYPFCAIQAFAVALANITQRLK